MAATVLLVNNDPSIGRKMVSDLTTHGIQIVEAQTGERAIEILQSGRTRLIVMDWELPSTNALQLCRDISSHDKLGFIYIIVMMLPGLEAPEHDERFTNAFDAGAADFLVKPVAKKELLARLHTGQRIIGLEEHLAQTKNKALASHAELTAANHKLAMANEQLNRLAATDELTGLPNRRTAMMRLTEYWSFSTRHDVPLACILIDIDHFKIFNDTFGHGAGDMVLKETAKRLRSLARVEDMIFRFGGEEFLILCPHTNISNAARVAERYRMAIESNRIHYEGNELKVTFSAGVAERTNSMPRTEELVRAADASLYSAKRAGRNQVYWESQPTENRSDAEPTTIGPPLNMGDEVAGVRQATVMVLHHHEQTRKHYRSILDRDPYRVVEATNSSEALDRINHCPPAVIVLEDPTPDRDLSLVRQLKANPATQGTSVLLIGQDLDDHIVHEAMLAGADEYMTKRFHPHELLLRVRSMIQLNHCHRKITHVNEIRSEQARMLTLVLAYTRMLAATSDLDTILDQTVAVTAELTLSRRVSIMLPDASLQYLTVAKSIGLDSNLINAIRLSNGSGIAGRVFASRRSIVMNSPENVAQSNRSYDSRFYASVPMISTVADDNEPVVGVLNVSNRYAGRPFEPQELEFIDLISNIAASAIFEIQIRQARDEARNSAVIALANLAEQRDGGTGQHLDRVTQFCLVLAEQLRSDGLYSDQIDQAFIDDLQRAVPLHDIGKVAVPDHILLKPGKLTADELSIMRSHVEVGQQTIQTLTDGASGVRFLKMAEDVAAAHHEWFDGSGYPRGLKGHEISLAARIAALADAYDAICSQRSYKDASSHEKAVSLVRERYGSQFDPALVDAFLACERRIANLAIELSGRPDEQVDHGSTSHDRHVA